MYLVYTLSNIFNWITASYIITPKLLAIVNHRLPSPARRGRVVLACNSLWDLPQWKTLREGGGNEGQSLFQLVYVNYDLNKISTLFKDDWFTSSPLAVVFGRRAWFSHYEGSLNFLFFKNQVHHQLTDRLFFCDTQNSAGQNVDTERCDTERLFPLLEQYPPLLEQLSP